MQGKAAGIDLADQLKFKTFSAIKARGLAHITRSSTAIVAMLTDLSLFYLLAVKMISGSSASFAFMTSAYFALRDF